MNDQMPVRFGCFRLEPDGYYQTTILSLIIRQFSPQDDRLPERIEGFIKTFDNLQSLQQKVSSCDIPRDAMATILRLAIKAEKEPNAAHFEGEIFFFLTRQEIEAIGFELFARAYWPR